MADENKQPETPENEENKPAQEPEVVEETADQAEEAKKEGTEEAAPAEAATEEETEVAEVPENDYDEIVPGAVVRVHLKIKETTPKGDERERIQVFEGTVIAIKGQDATSRTITVRKISGGVGVERIFPLKMPTIAKIETVKRIQRRRSKLYYLRNFKKRLKEAKRQPKTS